MDIGRVQAVVSQMTLKEKVQFLGCSLGMKTNAVSRLKVYSMSLGEELLFYKPILSALGCTFDRTLSTLFGAMHKEIAQEKNFSCSGAVNLGVVRDPMADGSKYMFSEDPFVVKELAQSYIEGAGMVFGTNILSGEESFLDRYMDERASHEIYFKPYLELASMLAGAVIPSGCLNGEILSESKKFVSQVAQTLPQYALILNEAGSIDDKLNAVNTGACFEIGQKNAQNKTIIDAIEKGNLFERRLDQCIERTIMYFAEYYETAKKEKKLVKPQLDFDERVAQESIVMLQNDGTLPFNPVYTKVAFGGEVNADIIKIMQELIPCSITKSGKDADVIAILARAEDGKLPSYATKLISNAFEAGKKSVLLIMSPQPIELPDILSVSAVFYVPCVYISTYLAIAKIISGVISPSGKLNVSWAFHKNEYPANMNERAKERGLYCYESVLNGYRYFNTFNALLRYPFGHGLSYTTFEYSRLECDAKDDVLSIEFVAKNTGSMSSENVVFVFADVKDASVMGIESRLIGFARVNLDPLENTLIKLKIDIDSLGVYNAENDEYLTPGGKYEIKICESASNVKLVETIKMPRSSRLNFGLDKKKVPSYFVEKNFKPSGTDMEKVVKMPLTESENLNALYLEKPTVGECGKFSSAVCKKVKKALKDKNAVCELGGMTKKAYKKILEADM